MSGIKKMELSWITVSDLEKAKKFYTEVLGLKVKQYTKEYNWLEVIGHDGGMILGICQEQKGPETGTGKAGSSAVVTMVVDDLLAKKKELEAQGVKFGGIQEIPNEVKLASFTDTDGNRFQLVQVLRK